MKWSMKMNLNQSAYVYLVHYYGPLDSNSWTVFAVKNLVPKNELDPWSRLIDYTRRLQRILCMTQGKFFDKPFSMYSYLPKITNPDISSRIQNPR